MKRTLLIVATFAFFASQTGSKCGSYAVASNRSPVSTEYELVGMLTLNVGNAVKS